MGSWAFVNHLSQMRFQEIFSLLFSVKPYIVVQIFFYKILGGGRASYILSHVYTSFLPILFFVIFLFKDLFIGKQLNRMKYYLILILFTFIPTFFHLFWRPTLLGYNDILLVSAVFLVYYIYFKKKVLKINVIRAILIGLLAGLIMTMRRGFVFWAVPFLICIFFDFSIAFYRENKTRTIFQYQNKFYYIVLSFFITFLLSPAFRYYIYLFNQGEIARVNRTHSGGLNFVGKAFLGMETIGFLWLLIFISFVIYLLLYDKKNRRLTLFLVAHFIISFLLVCLQNALHSHHFLFFSVDLVLIFLLGVSCFAKRLSQSSFSIVSGFILVFTLFHFYYIYCSHDGILTNTKKVLKQIGVQHILEHTSDQSYAFPSKTYAKNMVESYSIRCFKLPITKQKKLLY